MKDTISTIDTTGNVPVRISGGGVLTYNFAEFGEGAEIFDWCVVLKPELIHIGPHTRVDRMVKLEGGHGAGLFIGAYVHICSFAHINTGGGTVYIGNYAGIASGAKILGGTNLPDAPSMSAAAPPEMQHVARMGTGIGAYAFVGANAVVMPGLTLGEGAVVGAGAVVTHNIPAWETWAGVPAAKIGERDHAHF